MVHMLHFLCKLNRKVVTGNFSPINLQYICYLLLQVKNRSGVPIATLKQVPFAQPEGVAKIRIECKADTDDNDNTLPVGIQKLDVLICPSE